MQNAVLHQSYLFYVYLSGVSYNKWWADILLGVFDADHCWVGLPSSKIQHSLLSYLFPRWVADMLFFVIINLTPANPMKMVQLYMNNTDIYSCHLAIDLNVYHKSLRGQHTAEKSYKQRILIIHHLTKRKW